MRGRSVIPVSQRSQHCQLVALLHNTRTTAYLKNCGKAHLLLLAALVNARARAGVSGELRAKCKPG